MSTDRQPKPKAFKPPTLRVEFGTCRGVHCVYCGKAVQSYHPDDDAEIQPCEHLKVAVVPGVGFSYSAPDCASAAAIAEASDAPNLDELQKLWPYGAGYLVEISDDPGPFESYDMLLGFAPSDKDWLESDADE